MMFEGVSSLPIEIILIGLALFVLLLLAWRYQRRGGVSGSLGNHLLFAFTSVAGISVALVVGLVVWQIQQTLTEQTGELFQALAESNSKRLVEELTREVELLQELAETQEIYTWLAEASETELKELSGEDRATLLRARDEDWVNWQGDLRAFVQGNPAAIVMNKFISRFPARRQLILTDQYGSLVAVGGGLPSHYYHGDEVWWHEAWIKGKGRMIYIRNRPVKPGDQDTIIEIAVPVKSFGTRGLPQGMLYSQLLIRNLNIFASASSLGKGEEVDLALVDNTGQILYSSEAARIGDRLENEFQVNIAEHPLNWGKDLDETGQSVIHSHARLDLPSALASLDDSGWTITVQQTTAEALGVVSSLSQLALVGGLLALVLAVVVGSWVSQQLARPIKALTSTAVAMAGGQFDRKAPVSGPTELQTLAQAFNSMTGQLRQVLAGLEQQVVARTERLEIVATLGERLSAILNLDELLAEVVDQIQARFGYYHAHIYLLDDKGENLVVVAGTGEAGAAMKNAGHSILLDTLTSLVARAARTAQIIRVDNVRQSEGWLPNPLLPDTYSEMAVPITLEGRVVGVLDVQEDEIAALDEGDAALLRSLANQVAVAINNARLFEEVGTALREAREVQRRYVEQAWDRGRTTQRGRGRVQFSLGESTTLSETALAQARQQVLAQKKPALVALNGYDQAPNLTGERGSSDNKDKGRASSHALVAPITLGEIMIGNLQLHGVDPNRKWTEDDLALIHAVIDQVAQTAENLRLLDETQERASRERLIGQISDRLRRAPDIEALMKTAVEELSRVLDPDRTFVRLGPAAELELAQKEMSDRHKLSGTERQEEEFSREEFSKTETSMQPEDKFASLPEDSAELVDDEAEQEEEITSHTQ